MKAFLKNYRQSPRKVRLVADSIRGKNVAAARVLLGALPKRAALPVKKLLLSAVANTKSAGGVVPQEEDLYVREIRVDEGPTLKRQMPRAFGRSAPIRKRTSHISLFLAEQEKGKHEIPARSGFAAGDTGGRNSKSKTNSKNLTPKT